MSANPGQPMAAPGSAPAAGGGGDALDKGIDGILKKAGKGQSAGTTEKISDGIRKIFKKVTGKSMLMYLKPLQDVPVADKPMA